MRLFYTRDDFSESEHPRGQPANAGQFAPKPGQTSTAKEPTANYRENMTYSRAGKTTQPVDSLDDLYDKAKQAEPQFKDTVESIASAVGAKVAYTPPEYAEPGTILKSRASAIRKLATEANNDPTQLRDVLRATIVASTVADTRKAASRFIEKHGDRVLRVKDRYSTPINGYRDILINYVTPEGLVAEVQFGSHEMLKAKLGEGHKIYERMRLITPGSRIGPGDAKRQWDLLNRMSELLYNHAYHADGNGAGWETAKAAA